MEKAKIYMAIGVNFPLINFIPKIQYDANIKHKTK